MYKGYTCLNNRVAWVEAMQVNSRERDQRVRKHQETIKCQMPLL